MEIIVIKSATIKISGQDLNDFMEMLRVLATGAMPDQKTINTASNLFNQLQMELSQ